MSPLAHRLNAFALIALLLCTAKTAADPADYATQPGWAVQFPRSSESFSNSVTAFPATVATTIDHYPLAGRMLAATGRSIYLQESFGRSTWLVVAELDPSATPMDPSFLEVSPDGMTIALGIGFGKPLYVFPTSLLDIDAPPNLTTHPDVSRFDLNYYDAAFGDNRYLYLNAGNGMSSEIVAVDTLGEGEDAAWQVVGAIPGASAGITFDAQGNLVTGIGWDPDFVRTGEVRIFPAAQVTAATQDQVPLDYDAEGVLLARDLSSAAHLGFDRAGNLFVGGGDLFGTSGNYGDALLVSATVVERVLDGGAPLDPALDGELTRLAPDPCMNDDATVIVYVAATDTLFVSANLATAPPNCADVDWSMPSDPPPRIQVYVPPGAPDGDGDGVPDGLDPDHAPPGIVSRTDLARLVASFGASSGQPSFDAASDYDGNGVVDWTDYAALRARWAQPR